MEAGPLLFGILLALAVMLGFLALSKVLQTRDPVDARLQQYGISEELAMASVGGTGGRRRAWPGVNRLLNGFGIGPRLALGLARADMALTAAEFALLCLGLGLLGFAAGAMRGSAAVGLVLGPLLGYLPVLHMRSRQGRRRRTFTQQLPDVLTLLVGGLRAGYGLTQALDMLVSQAPEPAATEFGRVTRAINLGQPVQRALLEMAERVGSDDLDLVVTAMNVQYEMGGDLAQTLDTIAETVRDRIRIKREIRVFTAQQRFTGYALAGMPLFLGVALFLVNPKYMGGLFQPGWVAVPIAGGMMMFFGFLVIRKILDIEV